MENNKNISEKIKGNATSAYLMIFISGLFLFNKANPNINNSFVKAHTKTAMLIHLGFLITYIIFISNGLFSGINILSFGLNILIANIIFIGLLLLLVIGIYKVQKNETFSIKENINISRTNTLLDINGDGEVSEKEKITIILSFIPFIGFINFAKYRNNKSIVEGVRLNIIISLSILLLFIFSYTNLATLLSLLYIVLITFIGINLFTRNEFISIKLPEIFSPINTYETFITIKYYLQNYFTKEEFKEFKTIKKEITEKIEKENLLNKEELQNKTELKLPKFLIYIPILNLIFFFFINTKYRIHIINGLIITLLIIITSILAHFGYFNTSLNILWLFPILFGIGYVNNKLEYRIPVIFDIYILFKNIFSLFRSSSKKIKEKKAEENQISLKPKK